MSGALLHGLGDCTPELNCGCMTNDPVIAVDLFGEPTPEPTVQED